MAVPARRLATSAVGLLLASLAFAVLSFRLTFDEFPPSHLNLLFWVSPHGAECVDRAVNLEDIPLLGTGVTLGDMCPDSPSAG